MTLSTVDYNSLKLEAAEDGQIAVSTTVTRGGTDESVVIYVKIGEQDSVRDIYAAALTRAAQIIHEQLSFASRHRP